ncbi:MAG: RpiR family transcriptional regulator, partial [Sandarakinorhabdus sp.]|nr:RpiR family transcriptional regulator [Sandarakinorhabdus sp.]
MPNKVALLLRERYDQFTVAERMIAGWMLDNMGSIPFETGASIGQRVGVSAMT